MKEATLKEVRDFFGMKNTDFTIDWKKLSPEERDYFKQAVGAEIHKD